MNILEKLKTRSLPTIPVVVKSEILSNDDCIDIKNKIICLEKYWQSISPRHNNTMLPAGSYSRNNIEESEISFYRELMYKNFGIYYNKIKKVLCEHLGVSLTFSETLPYPGFHIFKGEMNKDTLNFHNDGFKFSPAIDINSYLVPIDLPKEPCGLVYTTSKKYDRYRYVEGIEYHRFNYTRGDLLMWSGNLAHSIGEFNLAEDEYRITLQFHVLKKKNTIFW